MFLWAAAVYYLISCFSNVRHHFRAIRKRGKYFAKQELKDRATSMKSVSQRVELNGNSVRETAGEMKRKQSKRQGRDTLQASRITNV